MSAGSKDCEGACVCVCVCVELNTSSLIPFRKVQLAKISYQVIAKENAWIFG